MSTSFASSSTGNSSARIAVRAPLIERTEVAPHHFRFRLQAPAIAFNALPGQFVHVASHPNSISWNFDPLLRRAFSIMDADPALGTIEILFRVGGRGTKALSRAQSGDEIDLLGPLGKPFDTAPFHVKQVKSERPPRRAVVVGGGVGVPPLIYLGKYLRAQGIVVQALIGARTESEVLGQIDLRRLGIPCGVATDDGSEGHHGRITELLQIALEDENNSIIYSCGPWPMLRAVAQLCQERSVKCQVSLEEAMPCGVGVCNGCVVQSTQPYAEQKAQHATEEVVGNEWSPYQNYRRICVEGPACWSHEIEWEQR